MCKRNVVVLTFILLLVVMSVACAPAAAPTTAPAVAPTTAAAPAPATAAPVAPTSAPQATKDTLVIAQNIDATTLDPQRQGKIPDMNILINMFDTLVTRDDSGKLAPSLATDWKAISDNVWEFKLRKDVKFQDGETFNAAAAKFSLDRLANPAINSPIAELRNVKSVSIVDDYTIDVTTDGPDPILPAKTVLFGGVMMPPKYVQEKGDDYVAKNPIGTGPFKFVSWAKDNQVVMEANADYWRGAPKFKKLTFRIIPNVADMIAALKTGEIDIAAAGLTADNVKDLKNNKDLTVVSADGIRTFYINLDSTKPPFDKKEVRQAVNYAIDTKSIIDAVFGGYAKRVSTIIPRQNFGYDASIVPYEYNPDKAKQLLAQAGYPNGLTVQFDADQLDSVVVQSFAAQLEKVGMKVSLNFTDNATLIANMTAKKVAPMYYLGNTGWTMDALSNFQSYIRSDRRYARINNPELDKLVDVEEKTIDPVKRQAAFTQAQQILKDEGYFIYLYQGDNILALRNNVSFKPNPIGILWMYTAVPNPAK
jgi:peptide/nickel transport system substrate-binding protein